MREYSHPGNRGQCPFYMDPDDVLTVEASIVHCVACTTRGDACLRARQEDFRQLAYLTIFEETPKYDPTHPSQASLITFIKACVYQTLVTTPSGVTISHVSAGRCVPVEHRCRCTARL